MTVDKLLFINKVKENRQSFGSAVIKYAQMLNYDPDWLMFIMNMESNGTFRPDIQNPVTKATGLIQFIPTTAEALGTSIEALKAMTNVQQLEFVYNYYKSWKHLKAKALHDVTLITFYPYAIGKSLDYIIGSEKSMERAKKIGKQNPILDYNKDGLISVSDYLNAINAQIDLHVKDASKANALKKKVVAKQPKKKVQKSIYQAISDLLI